MTVFKVLPPLFAILIGDPILATSEYTRLSPVHWLKTPLSLIHPKSSPALLVGYLHPHVTGFIRNSLPTNPAIYSALSREVWLPSCQHIRCAMMPDDLAGHLVKSLLDLEVRFKTYSSGKVNFSVSTCVYKTCVMGLVVTFCCI